MTNHRFTIRLDECTGIKRFAMIIAVHLSIKDARMDDVDSPGPPRLHFNRKAVDRTQAIRTAFRDVMKYHRLCKPCLVEVEGKPWP